MSTDLHAALGPFYRLLKVTGFYHDKDENKNATLRLRRIAPTLVFGLLFMLIQIFASAPEFACSTDSVIYQHLIVWSDYVLSFGLFLWYVDALTGAYPRITDAVDALHALDARLARYGGYAKRPRPLRTRVSVMVACYCAYAFALVACECWKARGNAFDAIASPIEALVTKNATFGLKLSFYSVVGLVRERFDIINAGVLKALMDGECLGVVRYQTEMVLKDLKSIHYDLCEILTNYHAKCKPFFAFIVLTAYISMINHVSCAVLGSDSLNFKEIIFIALHHPWFLMFYFAYAFEQCMEKGETFSVVLMRIGFKNKYNFRLMKTIKTMVLQIGLKPCSRSLGSFALTRQWIISSLIAALTHAIVLVQLEIVV